MIVPELESINPKMNEPNAGCQIIRLENLNDRLMKAEPGNREKPSQLPLRREMVP
jgi:hypothetical protein